MRVGSRGGIAREPEPAPVGSSARHVPCPFLTLSFEAQRLTMAITEDRAMTNVQLWILLWQKQIADKLERTRAAA